MRGGYCGHPGGWRRAIVKSELFSVLSNPSFFSKRQKDQSNYLPKSEELVDIKAQKKSE